MPGTQLQNSRRLRAGHPGGSPGANTKSISHRCHPMLVACVWELTKQAIDLPMRCLQGGVAPDGEVEGARGGAAVEDRAQYRPVDAPARDRWIHPCHRGRGEGRGIEREGGRQGTGGGERGVAPESQFRRK